MKANIKVKFSINEAETTQTFQDFTKGHFFDKNQQINKGSEAVGNMLYEYPDEQINVNGNRNRENIILGISNINAEINICQDSHGRYDTFIMAKKEHDINSQIDDHAFETATPE